MSAKKKTNPPEEVETSCSGFRRPSKRAIPKIMKALESIPDDRQAAKVQYPVRDVILLVLSAVSSGAKTWPQIAMHGKKHARKLRRFLQVSNIPSHDTIERVMKMVDSALLLHIYQTWCDLMHLGGSAPAELKGRKLLNIDGKAMRGSAGRGKKAVHVESLWDPQAYVCRGQVAVDEKSNEITAIPKLLEPMDLTGCIVTSDAMGTQVHIARLIREKGGDYLLALKGNQGSMLSDIELLADDKTYLRGLKKRGFYDKKCEKAHGQIETREYWIDDQIDWLARKDEWDGLNAVGYERTTLNKNGNKTVSWRFFLTSLPADVHMYRVAARGHWSIESMHNILDTAFGEDANQTIERTAAFNLNIIRKWALALVRNLDIGEDASFNLKEYSLTCDPTPMLKMLTAN